MADFVRSYAGDYVGGYIKGDAAPFSPASVSGLTIWLDASDTSTVTTGATVTWADKSGNGYDVSQSTGANQPSYTSGQYLEFNGTDINLERTQALGLSSLTVFGVFETIATAGFNNTIIEQGNDGENFSLRAGGSGAGNLGEFKTKIGGAVDERRTSGLSTATLYMLTGFYDETSGNKRIYLDGAVTSSATLSGAVDTDESLLQVGSRNGATTAIRIREIIAYDNSISEADANALGDYLNNKWGVTFDGSFDGVFP